MKLRVNCTTEISGSSYFSKRERIIASLPYELKGLYNLKFKELKPKSWHLYRIHFSVKMTEEELLSILDKYKDFCIKPEDVTYRVIKKGRNER